MKYPEDAWPFQEIEPGVFKSIQITPCLQCLQPTSFISYRFPRPAIPVCSTECHGLLVELQAEGLICIGDE